MVEELCRDYRGQYDTAIPGQGQMFNQGETSLNHGK
jgi:hypothetical protein